jgi:predicted DNA-binding helix-hairpin-helix protein
LSEQSQRAAPGIDGWSANIEQKRATSKDTIVTHKTKNSIKSKLLVTKLLINEMNNGTFRHRKTTLSKYEGIDCFI